MMRGSLKCDLNIVWKSASSAKTGAPSWWCRPLSTRLIIGQKEGKAGRAGIETFVSFVPLLVLLLLLLCVVASIERARRRTSVTAGPGIGKDETILVLMALLLLLLASEGADFFVVSELPSTLPQMLSL
jgi:hypothetical protein